MNIQFREQAYAGIRSCRVTGQYGFLNLPGSSKGVCVVAEEEFVPIVQGDSMQKMTFGNEILVCGVLPVSDEKEAA